MARNAKPALGSAAKAAPARKRAPVGGGRGSAAKPRNAPRPRPQSTSGSPPGTPDPAASPQDLLNRGLKAFNAARDDLVARQANVFENLLGAGVRRATEATGLPALDPLGIRTFEAVFDQRVAAALQRLGTPGADEAQQLLAALQALHADVQALQTQVLSLRGDLQALQGKPSDADASRSAARASRKR